MGASESKDSGCKVEESACAKKGDEKKVLKACCACPETKKVRDECVLKNGEENCADAIEAHKACMRAAGFNI